MVMDTTWIFLKFCAELSYRQRLPVSPHFISCILSFIFNLEPMVARTGMMTVRWTERR